MMAPYYPGYVLDCFHVSDHYPIVLPVTCDFPLPPTAAKKYCIGTYTQEDWERKDNELAKRLKHIKWKNDTKPKHLN